jgi:hypothetical protein
MALIQYLYMVFYMANSNPDLNAANKQTARRLPQLEKKLGNGNWVFGNRENEDFRCHEPVVRAPRNDLPCHSEKRSDETITQISLKRKLPHLARLGSQ